MRAKFRVSAVTPGTDNEMVHFAAVGKSSSYPEDGSDENNTFAKFTPSADLQMMICNPALIGKFVVGDQYYADFTKAD